MKSMKHAIHLLDLIEREKLDQILGAFTKATGVASIITEIDGRPISTPYNFTNLCENFCRSTNEGRRRCYESDMYGGRQSALKRKSIIYQCLNAGLIDGAAPVIIDDRHLANILFGQVLDSPLDRKEAVERARSVGIEDIDGYLLELAKVPIMTREQFCAVGNLMEVVTKTISELAYQKYHLIKHSKRNLNKLVNSVSDCILATDEDGIIVMANKAGRRLFNRERKALNGRYLSDLFSDDVSVRNCRESITGISSTSKRIDVNVAGADGRIIPMQMSLSVFGLSDSSHDGYVAVLRDMSEEKKLERMREDLAGMLSHDLGNPVLSIQKAMRLLADGTLGPLNDDQREVAGLALETSRQLYGMVTDFLDIYRYENHRLVLRKTDFDFIQLVTESVGKIKLFARDKNIHIHLESHQEKCVIHADRNRLMRVCINILENALQFSPEDRKIWIKTEETALKDDQAIPPQIRKGITESGLAEQPLLLVSISDQGLGISEKNQEYIFDKFFSSKARDASEFGRKGLGLGLAFCKLAIESHKGYIWLKSPLYEDNIFKSGGCRFSFVLPLMGN
jgi:PAS domain S-box-containing protein